MIKFDKIPTMSGQQEIFENLLEAVVKKNDEDAQLQLALLVTMGEPEKMLTVPERYAAFFQERFGDTEILLQVGGMGFLEKAFRKYFLEMQHLPFPEALDKKGVLVEDGERQHNCKRSLAFFSDSADSEGSLFEDDDFEVGNDFEDSSDPDMQHTAP